MIIEISVSICYCSKRTGVWSLFKQIIMIFCVWVTLQKHVIWVPRKIRVTEHLNNMNHFTNTYYVTLPTTTTTKKEKEKHLLFTKPSKQNTQYFYLLFNKIKHELIEWAMRIFIIVIWCESFYHAKKGNTHIKHDNEKM